MLSFFFVERVETCFELDNEKNQEAGGDSYRQPGNIDHRVSLIPEQIAQCGLEIVFDHIHSPPLKGDFFWVYNFDTYISILTPL